MPTIVPTPPANPAGVQSAEGPAVSAWLTSLDGDWAEVTGGYRPRALAKDEALCQEGLPLQVVYIVQAGRLRLRVDSVDGKNRHLMIIGPNGLAGDCGLFLDDGRYLVSAEAATDSIVCGIPAPAMRNALLRSPALMRQYQRLADLRFRIMLQHLALQGANSAKRRICHHLLGLMGSYGVPHPEGVLISISFTRQEMGHICGLSRISVSQILSHLEQERLIVGVNRRVVIRDVSRLASLAHT